jgi:gliding motility-associated-like protein
MNTGATTPDLLSVGSGTYVLTVTNAVGCVVGDTVTVSENPEPCFSIPGGLSPNGDNVNDTWTLNGLDNYPLAVIKVFNRWGQVIWSGDSESAGWDGTYEGKEMPTADYYYAIDLGNGEQYNGVVTLKR